MPNIEQQQKTKSNIWYYSWFLLVAVVQYLVIYLIFAFYSCSIFDIIVGFCLLLLFNIIPIIEQQGQTKTNYNAKC
jgi:hypothetical protein